MTPVPTTAAGRVTSARSAPQHASEPDSKHVSGATDPRAPWHGSCRSGAGTGATPSLRSRRWTRGDGRSRRTAGGSSAAGPTFAGECVGRRRPGPPGGAGPEADSPQARAHAPPDGSVRPRFTWTPSNPLSRAWDLRLPQPGAVLAGCGGLVVASGVAAVRLPDHRLLDRLVRGRWWIPVLASILIAIVAIQVLVLKDGADVGRYINMQATVQNSNESLRLDIAQLSNPSRVERIAAGLGWVMAGPTSVEFVSAGGHGAINRAIGSITAPNPQNYIAALTAHNAESAAELGDVPPPSTSTTVSATGGTTTQLTPRVAARSHRPRRRPAASPVPAPQAPPRPATPGRSDRQPPRRPERRHRSSQRA